MTSNLFGKTLCIVGGSGYIGMAIAKEAVNLGAKVHAISRTGSPKYTYNEPWVRKIKWHKGNAMYPNSFENILEESDAVIHTIGTSVDTSFTKFAKAGEEGTYEHMNYETAVSVGSKLNEIKDKKMVYLSASS